MIANSSYSAHEIAKFQLYNSWEASIVFMQLLDQSHIETNLFNASPGSSKHNNRLINI